MVQIDFNKSKFKIIVSEDNRVRPKYRLSVSIIGPTLNMIKDYR
jgi:hypothetical protein